MILDNCVGAGQIEEAGEDFERAVSCLASVARELLNHGYQVEALTRAGRVPFDQGQGHLMRILRAMALIELEEWDSGSRALPRPDSDSLALWFDYGFGRLDGAKAPGALKG